MLKRVVYGILAGSAVIFAILCLPKFIGNVLVTLLAIGGTNEFIKAMEKGGYKPLKAIPYLTCLGLLAVNGESSIMSYRISFSIFSFVTFMHSIVYAPPYKLLFICFLIGCLITVFHFSGATFLASDIYIS